MFVALIVFIGFKALQSGYSAKNYPSCALSKINFLHWCQQWDFPLWIHLVTPGVFRQYLADIFCTYAAYTTRIETHSMKTPHQTFLLTLQHFVFIVETITIFAAQFHSNSYKKI